ncbi:MAG: hypothetical protein ACKV22_04200 [Bryobacteraceae bacterium]
MTPAPLPPQLETLRGRTFSFYPAILGIEYNEWKIGRATWSEIEVVNGKSGQALWIARRFFGEVSPVDHPMTIVGLTKGLEFRTGTVWPVQKRVIEMPVAVNAPSVQAPAQRSVGAPVVGIRLEPGTETKAGRLVLGAMLVVAIAIFGVVLATREKTLVPRTTYTNADQAFLDLRYRDDYLSVVQRLGAPASVHSRQTADILYQALDYPARGYLIILMGGTQEKLHYIGCVDRSWNVVHSVRRPDGGDTAPRLRSLGRF